jgi:hypothetical protein
MIDVAALRIRYRRIAGFLDERGRRLFAANEALELGRGGVTAVSAASGIARSTINRGIAELRAGRNELGARIRRRGGGRKRAVEGQPGLMAALEGLIEGAIRGDPQSPLRWVSRSQRNIAAVLGQQGFEASHKLVGVLLRQLDYSCQANRKTREGTQHPDRNAQFEYINVKVKAALAAGQPAISVDTKKKELVGDFKNGGRELRRKGEPEPVRVHDFEIKGLGKVSPSPTRVGSMSGSTPIRRHSPSRASVAGGSASARPAIPMRLVSSSRPIAVAATAPAFICGNASCKTSPTKQASP